MRFATWVPFRYNTPGDNPNPEHNCHSNTLILTYSPVASQSALQLPWRQRRLQGGRRIQPKLLCRDHRVRKWGRGSLGRRLAAGGVGLLDSLAAVVGGPLEAELGVATAGSIIDPADLRPVGEDPRCHQRHPRGLATRGHVLLQRQLLTSLKQRTKLLLI
ncbi:atexpb2, expb2, athexp beta 1.4 atexpb2 (expansin b2) [Musa troglodytarum]|uniref:Atexpb2, expb2, athexp beta 1.4 atexpb2 (Expansin b2) n=1 Tax=Musa troglodytarum TaxID=320322 RepID=A0A9E7F0E5_9LILI|nr:atexpb2, expb2, athexp beta 1.4 atexpb2 (expansin b2) [Musa troglodytarum]